MEILIFSFFKEILVFQIFNISKSWSNKIEVFVSKFCLDTSNLFDSLLVMDSIKSNLFDSLFLTDSINKVSMRFERFNLNLTNTNVLTV
jgi:hypothetical protein